jgi:hypothetical protein
LLGLLNSKLGHFYFSITCAGLEGKNETYLRFFGQYLEGFPVKVPAKEDSAGIQPKDKLISLVIEMSRLRALSARTSQESTTLVRQIASTDREIDALVYQIYGLDPQEIETIERISESA